LPNLPHGKAKLVAALQDVFLVAALQDVFRDGSIKSVDVLMNERETLLTEIANRKARPESSEAVLGRIFGTFTHNDLTALAQPAKKLPPWFLP